MSFTRLARPRSILILLGLALLAGLGGVALAQSDGAPDQPPAAGSPIHPAFPLLDAAGRNVLDSGDGVSTMQTCGGCHDAEFIAGHSFHADAGLEQFGQPDPNAAHAWDSGPGLFGRWNAIVYRYLTPAGDERVDLTTPEWVQLLAVRHPGGGPAVTGRDGQPLADLAPSAADVETSRFDPLTGELVAWDWAASGTVELNCFLCHTAVPNNDARLSAVAAGDFAGASTATLLGTGLVEQTGDGWAWNAAAFDERGELRPGFLAVQGPTNDNCGLCHGVTHTDLAAPLTLDDYSLGDYSTLTTGQIMSPQRIADSGLNLAGKSELTRSWDVHTERVVRCTDCHYALNNPIYYQSPAADQPEHLAFDPRRIDLGEYLYRPLHQFAKGQSAQSAVAPQFDNTQRRCDSCHDLEAGHAWLPYAERHAAALSCETCHIPKLYAPALASVDWTVLQPDGRPVTTYRGVEEGQPAAQALITGYEPVLLPRANGDGTTSLAPFSLVTSWYWVYGDPARPVPWRDLEAAYLDGDAYAPQVLAAFDGDGDGRLGAAELAIDDEAKEQAIAGRLRDLGLAQPRIAGEVQPFSINHDVAGGEWATRDCRTCHSESSRVAAGLTLAGHIPGGVMPELAANPSLDWAGELGVGEDGALLFRPQVEEAGLYVLGHSAVRLIDWIGGLAFLGVLLGVMAHGGLRLVSARRLAGRHPAVVREVYMYDVYERLWHWLQTAAILLLIFTGLIIHKPDTFGIFSFSYVVQVHNVLAAILVVNAALALFYHLASGEIRQFLPRPHGFFDQAIVQAQFYLKGIFRREPHPFEKTRERKLNPLQQITYFGLLNVLLPLQILTGALIWGVQHWPDTAARLGGLPFLAPFHTLIAWLLATFVVMHVYLTTTGHTPLASIRAMMLGWDAVEEAPADAAGPEPAPAPGD